MKTQQNTHLSIEKLSPLTEPAYLHANWESAGVAIHLIDQNGIVVSGNTLAKSQLGLKDEEYIGQLFAGFFKPAIEAQNILQQLYAGLPVTNARLSFSFNNTNKLLWVSTGPTITTGTADYFQIISFELQDIKHLAINDSDDFKNQINPAAESDADKIVFLENQIKELKESEERYHKMISEVDEYAIFLLDAYGKVQNWNAGAKRLKGYSAEEIIGRHFSVFYTKEDIEDRLPEKLLKNAREKGSAIHEGWRLKKDGSKFWASIVITAIHGNKNSLIGYSKFCRDQTEKKLANDRLLQYAGKLEFQNKELEQVSYVASHDLKEPLRKIQFYNSFIQEHYADKIEERGREYLRRSVKSAIRMQKLINDILEYSRTSINPADFEIVNLSHLVNDIIELKKEDEENEWNTIQVNVGNLPEVHGISFQLYQLFDNLISNAIKYRKPRTKLIVDISTEVVAKNDIPGHYKFTNEEYHKIVIKDNGIGFDQSYSEKIFEIFQRLKEVKNAGGTGIGLAMCKKIVENHNGSITAEGSDDGASFSVYLPVIDSYYRK